jgi:hypothetical protein
LKEITRNNYKKYEESLCPEIFAKLDILTIQKRCNYFKEFITLLDKKFAEN